METEIIEFLKSYEKIKSSKYIMKFREYVNLSKFNEEVKKILIEFFNRKNKYIKKYIFRCILDELTDIEISDYNELEYIFDVILKVHSDEPAIKIIIESSNDDYCYFRIIKFLVTNNKLKISNVEDFLLLHTIIHFTDYLEFLRDELDYNKIFSDVFKIDELVYKIKHFINDKKFREAVIQPCNKIYDNFVEKIFHKNPSPILLHDFNELIRPEIVVRSILHGSEFFEHMIDKKYNKDKIYNGDNEKFFNEEIYNENNFKLLLSDIQKKNYDINCEIKFNKKTLLGFLCSDGRFRCIKILLRTFKGKIDVDK